MGGTKSSLPVAATRRSWFESGEEAAVAAQVLQAYRSLVADSSLCGIEDRGPGRELLFVSKIATQARDAVRCPGTTSIATPVCLARGEWVTRMLHSVPRRYLGECQQEVWTGSFWPVSAGQTQKHSADSALAPSQPVARRPSQRLRRDRREQAAERQ